ncbi:MAG: DNA polymerase III subunit gamma/tau [Ruminococcaceae bacterium]|nr:DNA polymerase III subunit gamma/tau [Oscillospiraceae bacterium]
MHQALYRKWRPRTFDDVCGQEHITSVLRYEIAKGTPSHAYLFCGSRGTGKTTCAKILAKAVNCEAPVDGSPCGKCAACLSIDNGSATDVLEMDAASNNGVDVIRDIRDEVVYTPSALKYRVYIVDEVHMLSTGAFNALLKTLEEPPAHVIFVLATTEMNKLPATIVSRCQRFDFRRIATSVLAARISYIAGEEGIELLPEAADRIARTAQGGMRDAISLLELCAGGGRRVDLATVNEMMGSEGREGMLRVVRAVASSDYDAIFSMIDEAVNASRDLSVFWQDLISVYRDLLVIKTTSTAARYLDLTDAEVEELTALAGTFGKGTLLAHSRLLEDAFFAMQRGNAVKRMVAELTLLRMCDPALDTSAEGLLARVERLEDAVATGAVAAPKPKSPQTVQEKPASAPASAMPAATPTAAATPKAPAAAPAAPAPVGKGKTLTRMRGFVNCVERMQREDAMYASFLEGARAFLDGEGRVILRLANGFAEMMLDRDMVRRALSSELKREVGDRDLIIEIAAAEADKNDTILDDIIAAAEN